MALNLYNTVASLRTRMSAATSEDDTLEGYLEAASRSIDTDTHRYFYTRTATLYADTRDSAKQLLLPEDLISMTTLTTDQEADGTYDGETWVANTDYYLWPYERYPKLEIQTTRFGDYFIAPKVWRYLKMVGIWGYGDGTSNPWLDSGTIADMNSSATTFDSSVADIILRGHTLKLDSEQMYVSNVTDVSGATETITVTRAVNGTTAAAHASGTTVYIAQYPPQIKQAALVRASRLYSEEKTGELESEAVKDYRWKRFSPENQMKYDRRQVAAFVKAPV